ncbi:MAG: uridine kinase [Proteobacteria bacterium]|nr:uridine kinase [Pseudomonadota bacterium]
MNRVLAIAGGSGSGKSTLAARLVASIGPERITVLPVDAYYHDLSHLKLDAREAVNFDHPDALDLALFADHVASLRSGEAVACPCYDFTTHCRLAETITIEPRPTLLVEGILVAATAELRVLYDHLVYVETGASVRWGRRLHRDQVERGRDADSIERFWTRAEQTFTEWGARALASADIVVDGSSSPEQMMAQLVAQLDPDWF